MNFIDNIEPKNFKEDMDFLLNTVKRGVILKIKEKIEIGSEFYFSNKICNKYLGRKYINFLSSSIGYNSNLSNKKEEELKKEKELKKRLSTALIECDDFTLETSGHYNSFVLTTFEYVEEPYEIYLQRIKSDFHLLLKNERIKEKKRFKESTRNVLFEKDKKRKVGRPKKINRF